MKWPPKWYKLKYTRDTFDAIVYLDNGERIRIVNRRGDAQLRATSPFTVQRVHRSGRVAEELILLPDLLSVKCWLIAREREAHEDVKPEED